ncbi:MAG TPA: hypothetical protein VMK82_08300 [Steroidobacteraceae bacterium]|nr:hypothetical protein [Steroidobacteraceae bacterium]
MRPLQLRQLAIATALGLAVAGNAAAATQVLVIAGLGGEPQYQQRFTEWSETVARASATATGDEKRVQRLSGKEARREVIRAALQEAAGKLGASDQFVLVLLGHGSYDGNEYRYMIEGPDLTGTELRELLDRIPAQQLVVNATSTSGALAESWANARRVVITATRSGGERNATRFGGFWAQALVSEAADLDKDGSVTAQEAYDYTVRMVADSYKSDTAILTERARLTGAEPSRFVVARLGAAALFASDTQLVALRAEQDRFGEQLAAIKARKAELSLDDYYNQIEPVLVEMARVGVRIDARFAALGVNVEGAGDANP